jgi:hypothetical protein
MVKQSQESNYNKPLTIFFLVTFIPLVILFYYFTTRHTDQLLEEVRQEFEFVGIEDEIHGKISIVSSYPYPIRQTNMCALLRSRDFGNKKICTLDHKQSKCEIGNVIEIGDSISKEADSYKITVYKKQEGDTAIYEFELCDEHGWPLKSE